MIQFDEGQYALGSFRIFVLHEEVKARDDMDAEIRLYLSEREQSHS